MMIYSHF
jgi:hypothetical protein